MDNSKKEWSLYQKQIFKNTLQNTGHTIVQARAGCGKTSSLIESFKYIPRGKTAIALAFNKIIQKELAARAPSYIQTATFHSHGLRAIKLRFGNVEINDNKIYDILKSFDDFSADIIDNVKQTIAQCKNFLIDYPSGVDQLIDQFGIDVCELDRKDFISLVLKVLFKDKEMSNIIDFGDMCWFPFVYNLSLGSNSFVLVDEFQDLNKSQMVMAKKSCDPVNGRMIFYGDHFQNLYTFRGSDSVLIKEIEKEPTTTTLSLPISYRCPKQVIDLVKSWVPDITCPDTAKTGNIENISLNQLYDKVSPGAFILSRTNAPLIGICMKLIRLGKKANIRGRDIGANLGYLVKKSKKKTIPAFLKWLEKWRDSEVEKLRAKKINPEAVQDKYDCLAALCEECANLEDVKKQVKELFNDSDEKNVIMLSSVHRAKGLEQENVFLLRWTFRIWFNDIMDPSIENEELNIAYVAATRSKNNLFLVNKFGT